MGNKKELTSAQKDELMQILKDRFEKHGNRHLNMQWAEVQQRLESNSDKLWTIFEMERTGGEPDVIGRDEQTKEFIFCDCSTESPKGRRSMCYDRAAWESRKEFKPANNAIDLAAAIGIEMLNEEEYRSLQLLGNFDTKTSSWIKTPSEIRKLGGAIFGDRRFNTIFIYHNGAESYYGGRAFRGIVKV